MAAKVTRKLLYLLLLCKICGIGIFMKGFFPLKRSSPGYSTINANGTKVYCKFNRLIIIMIDALRADFVFSNESYMSFTKSMIEEGNTFSFVAHSNPPTVTMPRIKAITTGTIPGFIDFILNMASSNLLEDNIVTQMKMSKLKVNFFGDDTWIKLFPQHFQRADGTTSFFVTDFTEVDNNVTRHLGVEMINDDWDVTILHYLGLDHIGHLSGPFSPLVQPKLHEMDNILKDIYTTTVKQDKQRSISTLIVLCGDHGMSDGGSHGGSSKPETTTPLVFMSSAFEKGQGEKHGLEVNQIDLAPTLSLLMGLSIPKNSIGILIEDLFSKHSPQQHLEALRLNALQMLQVFKTNTEHTDIVELDQAIKFHEEWLTTFVNGTYSLPALKVRAVKISQLYMKAMQAMTNQLKRTMSSYDYYALYIGIWLLVQSLVGSLCLWLDITPHRLPLPTTTLLFFLVSILTSLSHFQLCSTKYLGSSELFCTFSVYSVLLCGTVVISTSLTLTVLVFPFINVTYWNDFYHLVNFLKKPPTEVFLILGVVLHNLSLFSTSFIEEEHQTWYFLTTTYHLSVLYFDFRTMLCKHFYYEKEHEKTVRYLKNNHKVGYKQPLRDNLGFDTNLEGSGGAEICSIKSMFLMCSVLLCCDKVLRSWNQTGIKWIDQPDIADWLLKPENKHILSSLVILTFILITRKVYMDTDKLIWIVFCSGCVGVYVYRGITGTLTLVHFRSHVKVQSGIPYAQCVHFCVLIIMFLSVTKYFGTIFRANIKDELQKENFMAGQSFFIGYLLLILLLIRPHNIPLIGATVLQVYIYHNYIWKRCKTTLEVVLSAYFMGWFTYFCHGNSNSLASVDLAAGYIGLQQNHSPIFTGILINLATFSGPLFWLFNSLLFLVKQEKCTSYKPRVREFCIILLIIKTINVTMCACMSWLNCYHLFVWSVFSPKIFYETAVSIVFAIFIIIVSIIL